MRARTRSAALAALAALALGPPAAALETDQFYAWDRELADATDTVNAKINDEISIALAEVNARESWREARCEEVGDRLARRFRFFIFASFELWLANTAHIERAPGDAEDELAFRHAYVYHRSPLIDPVLWMPPSPTIEIAGVRIGTDKLTHFFSEGWYYWRGYRKLRRRGLTREEAEIRTLRRGTVIERTLLGGPVSGVLSLGDLEANHAGLRFLSGLCEEGDPELRRGEHGWELSRPFDVRDYVTPEWDESWHPPIYGKRRWKSALPVLRGYCDLLDSPAVAGRRRDYASRDRNTTVERLVAELVRKGKLRDPADFTIERACGRESGRDPLSRDERSSPSGRPPSP